MSHEHICNLFSAGIGFIGTVFLLLNGDKELLIAGFGSEELNAANAKIREANARRKDWRIAGIACVGFGFLLQGVCSFLWRRPNP